MNNVELLDAHGKVIEVLIDVDALDPVAKADPPKDQAALIMARINHLRSIMEAVDFYVETVVRDTAVATGFFENFEYRLEDRQAAMNDLLGDLDRYARKLDPNVQPVERSRVRPLEAAVAAFPAETAALMESLRKLEENAMNLTRR